MSNRDRVIEALKQGSALHSGLKGIASVVKFGFGGKERKNIHQHAYWYGKECQEVGLTSEEALEFYELACEKTPRESSNQFRSFMNGYQQVHGQKPQAESVLSWGVSRYFKETPWTVVEKYDKIGTVGNYFSLIEHNTYGLPAEMECDKNKLPLLLYTKSKARVKTDVTSEFTPSNIVIDFDDLTTEQFLDFPHCVDVPFKIYWQSSFSSTPDKPRGHVIIPLADNGVKVSKVEWADLVDRIIEEYFKEYNPDKSSKDTQTFISGSPILANSNKQLMEVYYIEE